MNKPIYILFLPVLLFCAHMDAQCFEYRHSTDWFDGWVSCEESPNPNPVRPLSHWIQYDFKDIFTLDKTWIWNYNHPDHLDQGVQEFYIDYSIDGTTWLEHGLYSIASASGQSTDEGQAGPQLGLIEARYVLLTVASTYGGNCAAISELRFEAVSPPVAIDPTPERKDGCLSFDMDPNPMTSTTKVSVRSTCTGDLQFRLINPLGQIVEEQKITDHMLSHGSFLIERKGYAAGSYILEMYGDRVSTRKLLVIQ